MDLHECFFSLFGKVYKKSYYVVSVRVSVCQHNIASQFIAMLRKDFWWSLRSVTEGVPLHLPDGIRDLDGGIKEQSLLCCHGVLVGQLTS